MKTREKTRGQPHHFSARRLHAFALLLLLPWLCAEPLCSQNKTADEDAIRAAMLFNLTKFIEWPSWKLGASHPEFSVCVLGSDPIGLELDNSLRNRMVGSKPLVVRHLAAPEAATGCHILYVSGGESKKLRRVADSMAKNAVLTVSERSNTEVPEQVIGLPTVEDRIHIEVNLSTAQQSGLTISSKLLHLATVRN
jgi:hypothetical protein